MPVVNRKKPDPLHVALKSGYDHYRADSAGNGDDSAQTLGEVFNHSRDWVYDVIKGARSFRLADLPGWIHATGDYKALEWVCRQVGVIAIRIPDCTALGCTSNTVRKFAGYLDSVVTAHEDQRITHDEARLIREMGEATISAIYAEIENAERSAGTFRAATLRDAS